MYLNNQINLVNHTFMPHHKVPEDLHTVNRFFDL